tara:strand:+ start:425 stop:877 length:453 start_codon:yes stop_codon:yes gene_type:complete
LTEPTLYCPNCGYNLTGLTENRCLECGEEFDLARLRKQWANCITVRELILHMIVVSVCLALFAMLITVFVFPFGLVIAVVLLIGANFSHAGHLAKQYVHTRQYRDGTRNVPPWFRNVGLCALLFMLIETAFSFACYVGGCVLVLKNIDMI